MTTYTHTGRLGFTGHYAVTADATRTPGKRHALNVEPRPETSYRYYRGLCGVIVPEDSRDNFVGQNEVDPAPHRRRVTCKRCLKAIQGGT